MRQREETETDGEDLVDEEGESQGEACEDALKEEIKYLGEHIRDRRRELHAARDREEILLVAKRKRRRQRREETRLFVFILADLNLRSGSGASR
jgi:hypothetical protein